MRPGPRTARLAGLLYLLVVLTGPFVLLYVPHKIWVPGDAAATAANVLAHETLFRAGILVGLLSEFCFLGAVLLLYRLLRDVEPTLAAVMAIVVLIQAPLAFLGASNEVATLAYLRNPESLAVWSGPERDAVTMLFLGFDRKGVPVSEIFWGLWLLPLAVLTYRSGFLPRFLGVWLFANGLAYLAMSASGLVAPRSYEAVRAWTTPALFGEAALMLWLLAVGVRDGSRAPAVAASP
jgi:hypothetical protein